MAPATSISVATLRHGRRSVAAAQARPSPTLAERSEAALRPEVASRLAARAVALAVRLHLSHLVAAEEALAAGAGSWTEDSRRI
jgi:hypothetical protein